MITPPEHETNTNLKVLKMGQHMFKPQNFVPSIFKPHQFLYPRIDSERRDLVGHSMVFTGISKVYMLRDRVNLYTTEFPKNVQNAVKIVQYLSFLNWKICFFLYEVAPARRPPFSNNALDTEMEALIMIFRR